MKRRAEGGGGGGGRREKKSALRRKTNLFIYLSYLIILLGGDVHLLQGDARVRVHLGRTGLIDLALRDAHRLLENDEGSLHVLLQARHGCAIVHRVLGASGRHYRVGVAVVRAA